MGEDQVGIVANFYVNVGVAAIKVTRGTIDKGDLLKYKGHTTDFTEVVTSMEVDRQPVETAHTGDLVGIKVKERVRENDKVFKVIEQS